MALISDFRAAIRALITARAFTAIAIVTLSTGMALAVLILAVLNAYVFRALPYPSADRLYSINYVTPDQSFPRGLESLDWSALDDVIELPIAWDLDLFYLLGEQYPESAPATWVTQGYMGGFGFRAALGRTFDAADFAPASPAVALISHRLWQSRHHGDPAIVGKMFRAYVSDRPEEAELFTVVGVLPRDLWHLNPYTEVLAPLKVPTYPYMVRLRAGVTPEVAAAQIDRHVKHGLGPAAEGWVIRLSNTHDSYVASLRPMLWSVAAGAALVLLIATANVTVLAIMRGRRREREFAVRLALGASWGGLARLLAFEGLLIGAVSTAAGVLVARATLPALGPLVERSLDRRIPGGFDALTIDVSVWAILVGCAALVTVLLIAIPLLTLGRTRLSPGLAGTARGTTDSRRTGRSRALLIALEVAASLTLLVGAALMAESAWRMLRVDFGLDPRNVMTAGLGLRQQSFPDAASQVAFFDRLTARVQDVVGDSAIALSEYWPLQSPRPRRVETGGDQSIEARARDFVVSPTYFDVLSIPIRDGRAFTAQDRLGGEPVVIVSATLAERLWPQSRAMDQTIILHPDEDPPFTARVIGVAGDTRQSHTDVDQLDTYLPLAQQGSRFVFLYARPGSTPLSEPAIRSAVNGINPEVAVAAFRPLAASIEQERARPQFMVSLLVTFAGVACILSLVGMHGVIAYAVRQRQREIAVRVAVGATAGAVTTLFLRQGLLVLAAGLVGGTAGAIALGRVLQRQLYGVQAAEPRVLAAAALAFGLVALAAMLGPAWRASTIDPMRVLKEE